MPESAGKSNEEQRDFVFSLEKGAWSISVP
jgi:hypothetical protein